jgi:hypothetical protein
VRYLFIVLSALLAGSIFAQQPTVTPAGVAAEDPADEIGKLRKNCPFHHAVGCAEVLLTGQPIHIAVGGIAPQNGIGAGLAYVGHKTTDNWRISWNADGVASSNASWRSGLYVKFVDSRQGDIGSQMGTRGHVANETESPEQPVINVYAQAISLNRLTFFGLGPVTNATARSYYGMTETILGASGVKPIRSRAHLSFYGELDGRWVQLRSRLGESSPSIEQLYDDAAAPGLSKQPFFLQLGVGARVRPSFRSDRFHLNYDLNYRPYFAVNDSHYSFQRLTADLGHKMLLYPSTTRLLLPRETNGPDDCVIDPTVQRSRCPEAVTRNLEGSIEVRLVTSLSMTPGSNVVPFYFQPTLGGGDINGNTSLSSYQDYRFRAPNLLLLRESFEHSIWKWPVGFALSADQGKVASTRADLGAGHWKHSYSTGLTLRAGGFPQVYLLFSWGGVEGTHTMANINSGLLSSSARPSLF